MQIRKFKETDKATLSEWLSFYNWPEIDYDCVPENSFIVEDNNSSIAFSFFAKSDTNIATLGTTISNPNTPKEIRGEALDMLSCYILKEAESQGAHYFMYFADKNPMVERMAKNGMTITDNGDAFILMKAFKGKNLKFFGE